jgi:hypothetical protein
MEPETIRQKLEWLNSEISSVRGDMIRLASEGKTINDRVRELYNSLIRRRSDLQVDLMNRLQPATFRLPAPALPTEEQVMADVLSRPDAFEPV